MKSTTLILAISAFTATATASPTPSPLTPSTPSTPPPNILPSYTTMRMNAANNPAPIMKSKITSKIARSVPESPPHNHSGLHHLSDPSTIALEHKSRTRKRTRRPAHAVDPTTRSSAQGDDLLMETGNEDAGEGTQGGRGGGDKFLAGR